HCWGRSDRTRHALDAVPSSEQRRHPTQLFPGVLQPRRERLLLIYMWCEGADERQVAVLLRVVETVADDELVRQIEPDIPHFEIHLEGQRFADHGADLHRPWPTRLEVTHEPGQCQTGVDH